MSREVYAAIGIKTTRRQSPQEHTTNTSANTRSIWGKIARRTGVAAIWGSGIGQGYLALGMVIWR